MAVANVGTLEISRTLITIVTVTAVVALVTEVVINLRRSTCKASVIYYLFVPTNAYAYIYIYIYKTNAPTWLLCFSAFDQNGKFSKNFSEHS